MNSLKVSPMNIKNSKFTMKKLSSAFDCTNVLAPFNQKKNKKNVDLSQQIMFGSRIQLLDSQLGFRLGLHHT